MPALNDKRIIIDEMNMNCFFRQTKEFIFLDKIDVNPGVEAEGWGRTQKNTWYFKYHFPNNPIMPGVFQMEAIQQTAGVIINTLAGKEKDNIYFSSAQNLNIRQAVVPGMEYHTYAKVISNRRGIWQFEGKLEVNRKTFCDMKFTLLDADEIRKYTRG